MAQTDQGESHGCCSKRKRFRRDSKRRTEAKLQVADQYCFVAHNRKHNQHQQEAKVTTTDELNKAEINQKLNPFGANSNRSSRYGSEIEKNHTTDANLSSVHCSLSSRQRGTPTFRASLNLSRAHSRSPSGSRSRSPHDWAPRNRGKIMANGGSTLWKHSRSPPNHMTKGEIGRMASPRRQPGPGYDDRAMCSSPLSRNNTYSKNASTWVDGRNGSAVDISDDHNKRYSRRSSPLRITSRNDRFDVMDSQGRPRSGEFYRLTQGRLLYGYDRENKHGRNGEDGRECTDRYANNSVKRYDRSGAESNLEIILVINFGLVFLLPDRQISKGGESSEI
ncbi:uncharacterized protein [Zea mays]|uniref:uncharacterized protein n=1 Tax=Zea mays TaxID=4577 RepID=UPI000221E84D|nr:uncharacterized protein LOC118476754 [Zea mays]